MIKNFPKKMAFLDLLLEENAKDDTPMTDNDLRAQVDTNMFGVMFKIIIKINILIISI